MSSHFASNACINSKSHSSFPATIQGISTQWIVDTGAIDHMVSDMKLFESTVTLNSPIPVTLPNGTNRLVTVIANVKLNDKFTLKDVLYIPEFRHNLLFVGRLVDNTKFLAIFSEKGFTFQDPTTKKQLFSGNKEGGLCKAHATNTRHTVDLVFYNATVVEDLKLFHARLGHPSSSKLAHLDKCVGTSDLVCDTCEMAKFHKLPFPVSTSRSAKAFDLIWLMSIVGGHIGNLM